MWKCCQHFQKNSKFTLGFSRISRLKEWWVYFTSREKPHLTSSSSPKQTFWPPALKFFSSIKTERINLSPGWRVFLYSSLVKAVLFTLTNRKVLHSSLFFSSDAEVSVVANKPCHTRFTSVSIFWWTFWDKAFKFSTTIHKSMQLEVCSLLELSKGKLFWDSLD